MRTTLDIDDDVLNAAKELARRERLSMGRMVSRLLRQGLTGHALARPPLSPQEQEQVAITGFQPFPAGRLVTDEAVNRLRDAEGI
ncbi:MAG TPA: DUF6364 family protein [Candidatus Competibacter sp.]|jgi:hypothetical protein|uniref:Antitoxin n=1 Tax=Candidatus Competibacter denitrificans Run_A_D11 TaxID=1400863 RepID=W6MCV4_9GAMM|nr:DUF6364 family protein [Candidatus Competibacter denitrificans]CDI04370.1 conserved hypothetical protein [Candidatus Competibacter denitrificans Run_A_D11]HRC71944.1 DUF6364 family protein [Candidatus Competibacter sp.]